MTTTYFTSRQFQKLKRAISVLPDGFDVKIEDFSNSDDYEIDDCRVDVSFSIGCSSPKNVILLKIVRG